MTVAVRFKEIITKGFALMPFIIPIANATKCVQISIEIIDKKAKKVVYRRTFANLRILTYRYIQ